jgi:uncharacterized repeat protein (TIGR03803 family)
MRLYRVVVFLLLAVPLAKAAERQILHGHIPNVAKQLAPLKRLESTNQLELTIALPLRNAAELNELLQQIYDPSSPNYHKYLTPEQFAQRFGPSQTDYDALVAFARSHKLNVTGKHPNRTLLDVNGSVADIEKALHLNLRVYQHPREARTFRAPESDPSLDLAVPVLSISGLDDFNLPKPNSTSFRKFLSRAEPKMKRGPMGKSDDSGVPYATGSGPRAAFMGKDFRTAYVPGVALDGAGQAVGLFQLDGYFPTDIAEYKNLAGLPNVPITNVLVNGFTGRAGPNNVEVALDIEMVISMAPGLSKLIVYEGTGANANSILNRMATDNLARQLSSSWGFGSQVDPAREQIFQQFAAQGQSMFQASGDGGAWTGAIFPPSDDPWLTVVGGTSLDTVISGGVWQSETTWSDGNGVGSGGGISTSYTIPIWQQGLDMAANQGSVTMRNIPDVAAHSEGNIWVIVNNGEEGTIGGTSAAAPLWAAFAALASQQAASNNQPSIGFINPAIYAIGKGPTYNANFHDITTGNNTNGGSPTKFFAVPGFDLCTGWGTPTGSNLIMSLVTPPHTLLVTPSANVLASGPAGGPLIPTAQTYTLTNFGSAPLSWSIVNTSLWLNASPSGGTLLAGGQATNLVLSLNAAASNLVAGGYSTTLLFSNLNDLTVQSRQFTLAIVTPPVITSQPVDQSVFLGATALFKVGTATNALLNFQWRRDGGTGPTNLSDSANISGSGSGILKITGISLSDVAAYSVVISNAAGIAVSSNASLTIVSRRPLIAAQPRNQTVLAGDTAQFAVGVIGSKPLYYQWQRSGTNLADGGSVSGSMTSVLTMANVSRADAATYSVVVTNAFGSSTSAEATLTVISSNAPDVTLTTLYSFSGGNDGANPNGLTLATNGVLYGTTQRGGTNSLGTIFQLNSTGAPTGLYSFGGENDGANPFAALTQGRDGNFYGTAFQGGAFDNGTIFRITPAGAFTNLFSLNLANGDLPYAGLTLATDGNFYGATYQGGASGPGAIFRITPAGLLTTIYSFTGGASDGGFPHANLTQAADGNLYGTTHKVGVGNPPFKNGTVFRISTNGTLTTLVTFDNTNGASSYGALTPAENGNLYGTTAFGGSSSNGTLFRISASGQFTNIYSFTGGSDGAQPMAGLFAASDGNLYGTTSAGGAFGLGTVFRMLPNGTVTNLASFSGFNGANPTAALVDGPDGNLYGTTQYGGANGQGTIFRVSFDSAPQIITQPTNQTVFAGANVPMSVVVTGGRPLSYQWKQNGVNLSDGGNISGANARTLTFNGVTAANAGIYSVVLSNAFGSAQSVEATLSVTSSPPIFVTQPTNVTVSPGGTAIFAVNAIGNQPLSYQWQTNGVDVKDGGKISGSTSSALTVVNATEGNNATYAVIVSNSLGSLASTNALLTVIPASAPGTRLTTLYSFTFSKNGYRPNGLAVGTNGVMYGTTQFGGLGTVFSVNTNGTVTAPFASFAGTNGGGPVSALVQGVDGNLYGTSPSSGTDSAGNIFRLTYGGLLSSLYAFTVDPDGGPNPNGLSPYAPLVQGTDGDLYGMTIQGGTSNYGTVFKINFNGALTTLYSFTNGSDGVGPTQGLIQAADGNFYGVTGAGALGKGNAFRMSPDGTLVNLHTFTGGNDGGQPNALIQGTDGNFYGTTAVNTLGSFQLYGIIFRMTPSGQVSPPLYMLNTPDGHYPSAGLIQASDGNFYGMAPYGGQASSDGGYGTIFRIAPNTSYANLVKFDGFNTGGHPTAALVEGPDGNLYGTTSTGGWGGGGAVFRFSYTSAPQIIMQPVNQTAWSEAGATFYVSVAGASPLSYQWQRNGINLSDGIGISGSTNRILTLANLSVASAGTYSVIVSNTLGTATSSGALLTVLFPPSFQTATKSNNSLVLSWSAAQGQKYQLQYKTNLNSTNWFNLGGQITAGGGTVSTSDLLGSNSQRFYRVILVP